jgi:hypothetical protein
MMDDSNFNPAKKVRIQDASHITQYTIPVITQQKSILFDQNARSKIRTCRAQSKSGNRLGYFLGSARASAAFSLICFKSVFQSSRTLCVCIDGGELGRSRGEEWEEREVMENRKRE